VTTTLADVDGGEIERLARALQAQFYPLTGARATGTALVARTGGAVDLPANAYAIPVDSTGDVPTESPVLLVKVEHNPATVAPFQQGGEWSIGASPTQVTFVANSGGKRFNSIKAGWKLRFDPPLSGLEPEATVDADWSGGDDGIVKGCSIYEEVLSADLIKTAVANLPSLVVTWVSSEPAEGRTAGISQGGTRKNRSARAYNENFVVFVVTTAMRGVNNRRKEGQRIVEAVRSCVTDRTANDDGELLTAFGTGVQVMTSSKVAQSPNAWVYAVQCRLSTVVCRVDTRQFAPWERGKVEASLPATPPGQPTPLPLVAPDPAGDPVGLKFNMP